jgi:hemerythrin-like domain-containing protein
MPEGTPIKANVALAQASYPTYTTNVLENLQAEHETAQRLLSEFTAAVGDAKIVPFAELKGSLRRHMEAEEEVFYPVIEALGVDEATLVTTAETEHDAIEAALAAIESAGAENATGGQITTLTTAINDHVAAERNGIFKAARANLTASQLRELVARVNDVETTSTLV